MSVLHRAELSLLGIAFEIINEFSNGLIAIYPVAVTLMLSVNRLALDETFHHNDGTSINNASSSEGASTLVYNWCKDTLVSGSTPVMSTIIIIVMILQLECLSIPRKNEFAQYRLRFWQFERARLEPRKCSAGRGAPVEMMVEHFRGKENGDHPRWIQRQVYWVLG
ncbi:hypothetical protein BT96DRAFT_939754 [Gymnopus androsaceus JB14]|uniref:Uncharacterized protein n=1 Tax=Gymnopus androsaceus JB14 TaxID=1447944 RepID=A0A6A4HQ81_9AGAR|nr:hypothetical protein BT96DRAFT_939754 [Gymnopus androsaceus JB14]